MTASAEMVAPPGDVTCISQNLMLVPTTLSAVVDLLSHTQTNGSLTPQRVATVHIQSQLLRPKELLDWGIMCSAHTVHRLALFSHFSFTVHHVFCACTLQSTE